VHGFVVGCGAAGGLVAGAVEWLGADGAELKGCGAVVADGDVAGQGAWVG
jgi:hypothetical protein